MARKPSLRQIFEREAARVAAESKRLCCGHELVYADKRHKPLFRIYAIIGPSDAARDVLPPQIYETAEEADAAFPAFEAKARAAVEKAKGE